MERTCQPAMFKLGSACYAIRVANPYMLQETIRMIYFSYFHSVMTCGIIFCGNSPHSVHIFRLQKRIFGIITNSWRELFKKLKILPLQSQYIFSFIICG
jgi:hypothetical protein